MARAPRKRLSLSFSSGHRLAKAFEAAGMGTVPKPGDVRTLLELGLAARAAGLMAVRDPSGCYLLVQPLQAGLAPAAAVATPVCVSAPASNTQPVRSQSESLGSDSFPALKSVGDNAAMEGRTASGACESVVSELEDDIPLDPQTRELLSDAFAGF